MLLVSELALFLIYTALLQRDSAYESSQDYYDDYQELGEPKGHMSSELEHQLRSVSSVDELMTIFYPEHWKMLKCQLMKGRPYYRETGFGTVTEEPVTFAATYYNPEILKSIDTEWKRTQCMPREVSLDVGKEFGSATNIIFKPSCVSVYRCGGCCNSEGVTCMNTSTSYVSKTLFEITVPISQGPKPITISVCKSHGLQMYVKVGFLQTGSLHHQTFHIYIPVRNNMQKYQHKEEQYFYEAGEELIDRLTCGDTSYYSVCGPNKELDEETCQCVCKGGRHHSSCGRHKVLDKDSCQCVCKNGLYPALCGPHKQFDVDSCECVCKKTCPKNQPLNPVKCVCECTETPNKCFLKGSRFHPHTCSCYRLPCAGRTRRCSHGYYFSKEVCRCVPTYWRRPHTDYY